MISGVVFMFWNVENFFDPFDDLAKNDDDFTAAGRNAWSNRRFEVKCYSIAKTILSVQEGFGKYPVIVGLAEVENDYVLRRLTQNTPLYKLNYGFIHRESPDARGIDVALLYRKELFKPLKVEALKVELPNGSPTRDILYVRGVLRDKDTLHIFVNHWPSKRGGEEETQQRREAAEATLKSKLKTLEPGASIIVMGDFNQSDPIEDSPLVQHNVARGGTIKFQGTWEQIDYFYTSNNIAPNATFAPYRPDFLIEDDKAYLGKKPRRTYIGPRYNGGVSDHLPIILRIK